ncbi:MAG: hypothetical protein NVSMB21_19480 [Vulcanimicrobiaceae bacterium]
MDIVYVFCIALGAALGSFAALVYDRTRRGESIVRPASHCGACSTPLRPWDNLPIVAWLALRGRCRFCKAFIPLHVLTFEVVGAAVGWSYAHGHFR